MYLRTERILKFWKNLNRRLIVASVMYSVLAVGLLYKIPYENLKSDSTFSWIHVLYFFLILIVTLTFTAHGILNKLKKELKSYPEDDAPHLRIFNTIIDFHKRNKTIYLGKRITDLSKELRGYSYDYIQTAFLLAFSPLFLPGVILTILTSLIISLLAKFPFSITYLILFILLIFYIIWIFYCIIFVFFAKKVYLDPMEAINPHCMITGTSGSGKSSLLKCFITDVLIKLKIPILCVDFHNEFMEIVTKLGGKSLDMEEISLNIFSITSDSPRRHIDMIIGLIHSILPLGQIQQYSLENILYNLYNSKGIFEEDPTSYRKPAFTTQDVLDMIQQMMNQSKVRKERDSLIGLYRRLDLLFGSNIFGSKTEIPYDSIFQGGTVIALANVSSEAAKKFILEMLLRKLYEYMLRREKKIGAIQLFVVIDEAPKLLIPTEDSIPTLIAGESRKYGISLVLSGQTSLQYSKSLIQNVSSRFEMLTVEPYQFEYSSRLTACAFEENPESDRRRHIVGELLRSLNPLEFIFSNSVFKNPIVCKLDPPWKRRYIQNAEKQVIEDNNQIKTKDLTLKRIWLRVINVLKNLKKSPRSKTENVNLPSGNKEEQSFEELINESKKNSEPNKFIQEKIMRKLQLNKGVMQKTQLLKVMNMSTRLFYDTIDEMKKSNMIDEVEVNLTDKKTAKYITRAVPNKSSMHFVYVSMIAEHLSKSNYNFLIKDSSDSPDLEATISQETLAIEVESAKKKAVDELKKMLARRLKKYNKVIIVTPPSNIESMLSIVNEKGHNDRIFVMTLEKFFKFFK